MFQSHFIRGSDAEKNYFRRYTNKLTKIKAHSKKLFFAVEFANSKGNVRKTWEIIRSVIQTNSSHESPSARKVDGELTEDPTTIANQLNNYFCTIGANLANNLKEIKHKDSKNFLKEFPKLFS